MRPTKKNNNTQKFAGLKISSKPNKKPKLNPVSAKKSALNLDTLFPDKYASLDVNITRQNPQVNSQFAKFKTPSEILRSKPARLKKIEVPELDLQMIDNNDKIHHPKAGVDHSIADIKLPPKAPDNKTGRGGIRFDFNLVSTNQPHGIPHPKGVGPVLGEMQDYDDNETPEVANINSLKPSEIKSKPMIPGLIPNNQGLPDIVPIHTLVKLPFDFQDATPDEVKELLSEINTLISRSQKIAAKGGMLENLLTEPDNSDIAVEETHKFVNNFEQVCRSLIEQHNEKSNKKRNTYHNEKHPYYRMEERHDAQIINNEKVNYEYQTDSFTATFNNEELFKIKTDYTDKEGVQEANVTMIFDPKMIHTDVGDVCDSLGNDSITLELLNIGNEFQDLAWKYLKKMREEGTAFEHRFAEVMCTDENGKEIEAENTLDDMIILLKGAVQAMKIGAIPYYSDENLRLISKFIQDNIPKNLADQNATNATPLKPEALCAIKLNSIMQKVIKPTNSDNPNFKEVYKNISKLPIMEPLTNQKEYSYKYQEKRDWNVNHHNENKPKLKS